MSEAEIKERYRLEMWWFTLSNLWYKLGEVLTLEREIAYNVNKLHEIRARHVRRGRKAKAA